MIYNLLDLLIRYNESDFWQKREELEQAEQVLQKVFCACYLVDQHWIPFVQPSSFLIATVRSSSLHFFHGVEVGEDTFCGEVR